MSCTPVKLMTYRILVVAAVATVLCSTASAQYEGLNVLGDVGLKAGSQPLPGYYATVPLYYRNNYTGIRDEHGNELLHNQNLDVDFLVTGFAVVTPFKVAGATWGFQVAPGFLDEVLDVAAPTLHATTGFGFTDLFVQPVNLGWRTQHGDFLAAYGFFAPTGGRAHGLDMWAHEITAGMTFYPDAHKVWNISTAVAFDINMRKQSTDVQPGKILTVEGGAGRSFHKGLANAGLAYAAQWKITHDSGAGISAGLPITNGRVFALGPEIAYPLYTKGTNIMQLDVRYLWEFGAVTSFEGRTLVASLSLAHIMLPHPGKH